nr:hypothetical protein [Paenibacillus sp. PAMC21692]
MIVITPMPVFVISDIIFISRALFIPISNTTISVSSSVLNIEVTRIVEAGNEGQTQGLAAHSLVNIGVMTSILLVDHATQEKVSRI